MFMMYQNAGSNGLSVLALSLCCSVKVLHLRNYQVFVGMGSGEVGIEALKRKIVRCGTLL
jgi:hypothetical protein